MEEGSIKIQSCREERRVSQTEKMSDVRMDRAIRGPRTAFSSAADLIESSPARQRKTNGPGKVTGSALSAQRTRRFSPPFPNFRLSSRKFASASDKEGGGGGGGGRETPRREIIRQGHLVATPQRFHLFVAQLIETTGGNSWFFPRKLSRNRRAIKRFTAC